MVVNDRTRMLVTTIQKLHHRGALVNIRKIIAKTHAADVAAVLQLMPDDEAFQIFTLEARPEERAQILSYLESDFQKKILERLSPEEASVLVQKMEPDDAADLLAQLPQEDSRNILEGFVDEDSTEVVGLMGYPEESAGGIMSSDYLSFPEDTTVEQVVQALQSEESENQVTFYVYVVNRTGHLVGVVSLKQLLLSRKNTPLRDLMVTNVIAVKTDTDQEHVAGTVAKYDFLSVPVVDENNVLIGVITVDDVIDVLRQEAEEDLLSMGQAGWGVDMNWFQHLAARFPWIFLSFLVGATCFAVIYFVAPEGLKTPEQVDIWAMAAMIPMLLSLGVIVGNQSSTVFLSAMQTGKFWGGRKLAHLSREYMLGLVVALIFGGIVYALGRLFFTELTWVEILTAAVSIQILISVILGTTVPPLVSALKVDPLTVAPPVYMALAFISSMLVLVVLCR